MDELEQPLDTLRRELREETGLEVEPLEFVGAVSDRYGSGGNATLNLCWTARVVAGEPRPGDDVAELRWFAPDELPPNEELAFANTAALLDRWIAGQDPGPPLPGP
jgi:ADP-ribose pyrophosphatase YjhB (NUDIX family)